MIRILGHHKVKINLKERKKRKKERKKKRWKNQKPNTHLIFLINLVDVSGNYRNKLMKNFFWRICVLYVDAQYALNTRVAGV